MVGSCGAGLRDALRVLRHAGGLVEERGEGQRPEHGDLGKRGERDSDHEQIPETRFESETFNEMHSIISKTHTNSG